MNTVPGSSLLVSANGALMATSVRNRIPGSCVAMVYSYSDSVANLEDILNSGRNYVQHAYA